MALDLETRLDSALNRIAQGTPFQAVMKDVPEAADLLVVAEQLQLLAPAPAPDLSPGRSRFLAEAARLEHRPQARPTPGGVRFRLALSLGVAAFVIAIVGNLFFVQIPASPTRIPTFTVTPTRFSLAPEIASDSELVLSGDTFRAPIPAPVPVPIRLVAPSHLMISTSQSFSRLSQWSS